MCNSNSEYYTMYSIHMIILHFYYDSTINSALILYNYRHAKLTTEIYILEIYLHSDHSFASTLVIKTTPF